MTADVWCKSGRVPVQTGGYRLGDGTAVSVRRSARGRFYAITAGRYAPGMVWRLRAELDAGSAQQTGDHQ